MANYDYDLFVIGAGSGGVRAARLAAQSGARVAIAEEYRIGGTCVIRGCVPKKLLVYASEYARAFEDAAGFGWSVENPRFDWPTLRDTVQDEVGRLSAIYRRNLEAAGVAIIEKRASLDGPHGVRIAGEAGQLSAERILVATGGRPYLPEDLPGAEHLITSNEVFHLPALPERVVVAGGGFIAVEFASIFQGLGVDTTLVYRGETILRGFDDDLRAYMQAELTRIGVKVITNAVFTEVALAGKEKRVTLSNGARLVADEVMMAAGRWPNTAGLGLESAGVALGEHGAVIVDAFSRTRAPSVFALGDVTNRLALTPVAIREAQAFFETEFMGKAHAFDHAHVPQAVFGRPPLASVGMTEATARAQFGEVDVYKTSFRPMKHVLARNEQKMLMKMLVHREDKRVLGVHVAGQDAPEIVQIAAVAVKAGLTKSAWDETCALHPTAAEELVLMR